MELFAQVVDDFVQLRLDVEYGFFTYTIVTQKVEHTTGDACRLLLHGTSHLGEAHESLSCVYFALLASHDTLALHALNERSHRVGFESQSLCDIVDGEIVSFPQYHEYEVLRVGHSETIEVRAIGLYDEAARCIEAKAELIVEFELIVGHVDVQMGNDGQ